MKAVRTDQELECPEIDAGLRAHGVELVTLPDGVCEDRLMGEVADADLLLMCYTPISARVISAAKRLKGIVKYGVGIDAIDIQAASIRGIPVVNVPDYAQETVAEGAFALMIALARRLPEIGRAMERDGWIWPERRWLGRDIAGATLGLVGRARSGAAWPAWRGLASGRVFLATIRMSMPWRWPAAASKKSTIFMQCCANATSFRSIPC